MNMAIQMVQDQGSSLQLRLEMEVNRLKLEIERKDQILAQQDQSFKRAEQEKFAVAQGLKTIRHRLQRAQTRLAQLLQDKNYLEATLATILSGRPTQSHIGAKNYKISRSILRMNWKSRSICFTERGGHCWPQKAPNSSNR